MDWEFCISFSLNVTSILMSIVGILLTVIVFDQKGWLRRFSVCFFSLVLIEQASSLTLLIAEQTRNSDLCYQMYFIYLIISLIMPVLPAAAVVYGAKESFTKSRFFKIVIALSCISIVSAVAIHFYSGLITFVADGHTENNLINILRVLTLSAYLFILIVAFKKKTDFPKWFVPVLAAYGFFSVLPVMIAAEILIIKYLADNYYQQLKENSKQKVSLAVLQMRPHFIYNTMTSIYCLIEQDPEKAQQVTLDFTNYLRKNFTMIAQEDTIPFTEELEHTKAYLAVEQVRFEDKLSVMFDTQFTAFRLPALTLQPIVENAVKHGVDPELEPVQIAIRTRNTENGAIITVEDNGPGFEISEDDNPHIALSNIREKLRLLCGGSLTIQSGKEKGTVVTIIIPNK